MIVHSSFYLVVVLVEQDAFGTGVGTEDWEGMGMLSRLLGFSLAGKLAETSGIDVSC